MLRPSCERSLSAFALRETRQRARVTAVHLERLGQADLVDPIDEVLTPAHHPHQRLLDLLAIGGEVDAGAVGKRQHADAVRAGELIEEARRGDGCPPAATDADALEIEDDQDETSADGRLVGRERKLAAGQRGRRSRRVLLDELRRHDTPRRPVDREDEVFGRQVGNRLAAIGDDGRVNSDELGGRAEGGL